MIDGAGERDGGNESDRSVEGWPVDLTGVVESVVTTLGPNDRCTVAALGLRGGKPVTAKN
jgi:hypothetical protein